MAVDILIHALIHCLVLTVVISAAPLLTGMLVGLLLSIFQAATQIQEQTLSFAAKISAMGCVLYFLGDRLASELVGYAREVLLTFGNSS